MAAISEGFTVVKLTTQPINVSEELNRVNAANCGAISLFLGTTRADVIDGAVVSTLVYEAYDSMALKVWK